MNNGDRIAFWAERVTSGNPVTGIVTKVQEHYFSVYLTKKITYKGLVFYAGEDCEFRTELVKNISKL